MRHAEVQPCAGESTDDRYLLAILMIGAGTMAPGESLTPRNEADIGTALKHSLSLSGPCQDRFQNRPRISLEISLEIFGRSIPAHSIQIR